MLSCTGRALVCLYCTRPNAAPIKQITMPRYISVKPLTPPKPSNLTVSSAGILISASLPKAAVVTQRRAKMSTPRNHRVLFLIVYRAQTIAEVGPMLPVHFLTNALHSSLHSLGRFGHKNGADKPGHALYGHVF